MLPFALALVWEASVRLGFSNGRLMPPPSRIAATLWDLAQAGELASHAGATLWRVAAGFGLGAAAGTVLEADADEGDELAVGTRVSLVVATGRVAIVDYSGFTLDAASRDLEQLGLSPEPVGDPGCPGSADDPQVSRQQPAPGEVDIHSAVQLFYCTGE
jgi:hypothetical protein